METTLLVSGPISGVAITVQAPLSYLASPIKPGTPVLKSVKLSRHFGGIAALSDCDLQVSAGEILAVIGPNACGRHRISAAAPASATGSAGRAPGFSVPEHRG